MLIAAIHVHNGARLFRLFLLLGLFSFSRGQFLPDAWIFEGRLAADPQPIRIGFAGSTGDEAYGEKFSFPMLGRMEILGEIELTFYRAIASGIISIATGENAREMAARALRGVGSDSRPSYEEINQLSKEAA